MAILRDYQEQAVAATYEAWNRVDSVLLEMATGTGKTEIFAHLAKDCLANDERALIVAPQVQLVGQAANKIKAATGIMPDIEQAENSSNEADWCRNQFVVASKQTLCRVKRNGTKRYEKFRNIKLLVLDEAHLFATKQSAEMVEYFRQQGARVLGVTATAKRHDQRALGQLFGECPFQFGIVDGLDQAYLVPPMVSCVQLQTLDLGGVETKQTVNGKDFDTAQLNERLEDLRTVYEIADVTARECNAAKTVVYC